MKNGVAQLVPPAHPIFHTVRSAMTNFTSPPALEPGSREAGPAPEPGSPGARGREPGGPEPGIPVSEPGAREAICRYWLLGYFSEHPQNTQSLGGFIRRCVRPASREPGPNAP